MHNSTLKIKSFLSPQPIWRGDLLVVNGCCHDQGVALIIHNKQVCGQEVGLLQLPLQQAKGNNNKKSYHLAAAVAKVAFS